MTKMIARKKRKLPIKEETLIKIHVALNKFLSVASQVSDVALTIGNLRNKPGPIAWIAAGTKITNLVYHNLLSGRGAVAYQDPLNLYLAKIGGNWTNLQTNKNRIVKLLKENNIGEVVEEEEEKENSNNNNNSSFSNHKKRKEGYGRVIHAVVEGNDIIWKDYGNGEYVTSLMIRTEQKEKVFKAIGNLIWNSFKTNCLATSNIVNKNPYGSESDSSIEFTEDLFSDDVLQSEIGDKIAKNIGAFLAVDGIDVRAILLYGPPGTGKSTAARYIAHKLGMRSLRVHFKLLKETSVLIQCLEILCPDVIIVDDIDRSPNSGLLLECLELLRKRAKVIIASANFPKDLDCAVLRPGRFDEAIHITSLDEKVIRRTVGDVSPSVFERIKNLPIAYINEFSLRRKILGDEETSDYIKELYERIEMGNESAQNRLTKEQKDYDLIDVDLFEIGR